jgi:SAM-dependent methyltransferase
MAEHPPGTLRSHYDQDIDEDARLRGGLGRLELARVQEVVRRSVPRRSGLAVVDVGGATGVHAEWLLDDGHDVHLVDLLPRHVERARERLGARAGFRADVGDARHLPREDATADVVLVLGPLYHLQERSDRVAAWREAHRVLVPGGVVVAMAISRFASLMDGLAQSYLFEPGFRSIVQADLATGRHANPTGDPRWFTDAYFHHPDELPAEAQEAGLDVVETVGVEGMVHWMKHLAPRWEDPADREVLLESARAIEHEPTLLGLSSHLLTVARRP